MSNYADGATPTAKLVVAEASRSYAAVPGCPTGTQSPVVLLYDDDDSFSYSTATMFWRPRQAAKEKREGEVRSALLWPETVNLEMGGTPATSELRAEVTTTPPCARGYTSTGE
jgi:hypothetical protein